MCLRFSKDVVLGPAIGQVIMYFSKCHIISTIKYDLQISSDRGKTVKGICRWDARYVQRLKSW